MLSLWDPFLTPAQHRHRHHRRNYWDPFDIVPRALYTDLARMNDLERELLARLRDESCTVVDDKDKFGVQLDVRQFKPEEVEVKVHDEDSKDGAYLVINAKHEERSDEHGFVSRQFSRRLLLPPDVDVKALQCNWSPDGVLSLSAPRKALPPPDNQGGRAIPITRGEQSMLQQEKK